MYIHIYIIHLNIITVIFLMQEKPWAARPWPLAPFLCRLRRRDRRGNSKQLAQNSENTALRTYTVHQETPPSTFKALLT